MLKALGVVLNRVVLFILLLWMLTLAGSSAMRVTIAHTVATETSHGRPRH